MSTTELTKQPFSLQSLTERTVLAITKKWHFRKYIKHVPTQSSFPFVRLPTELQLLVAKHMDEADIMVLRLTCRKFFATWSKPTLSSLRAIERAEWTEKLAKGMGSIHIRHLVCGFCKRYKRATSFSIAQRVGIEHQPSGAQWGQRMCLQCRDRFRPYKWEIYGRNFVAPQPQFETKGEEGLRLITEDLGLGIGIARRRKGGRCNCNSMDGPEDGMYPFLKCVRHGVWRYYTLYY